MLTAQFNQEYLKTIDDCECSLIRHPKRSMQQRLLDIAQFSENYQSPEVYGCGALVNEFEQEVAGLLGQPAALFMPSGTMAQAIALKVWAQHNKSQWVAFHPLSHLQLHEQRAYSELYGMQACLIGNPDNIVELTDLHKLEPSTAAVLLELPMRELGGQLPRWETLKKQSGWAKEHGVALHLDGARVWSCCDYYQKSVAQIG